MMNDVIRLEEMSEEGFAEVVEEAFRLHSQWRKNRVLSVLAESVLTESSLVRACFLTGEESTPDARGRGLQALLFWVVDRLAPGGTHSFTATPWRLYNSLFYPYLDDEGLTFEELAEKMALGEGAVFKTRLQALEIVAYRLRTELKTPQDLALRKKYYIARLYRSFQADEQKFLHLAALLRCPIPLHVLQRFAEEAGIPNASESLHTLIKVILVQEGQK